MSIPSLDLSSVLAATSTPNTTSLSSPTSAALFATTLAQAASEVAANEGAISPTTPGTTLFSQALSEDGMSLGTETGLPSTGGDASEINVISQLLAASGSSSSTSADSTTTSLPVSAGTSTAFPSSLLASLTPASSTPTIGSTIMSLVGASGSTLGASAVSEAAKFEGVPYVWGGTSPQGFDCSGLVQYVFNQLGVHLPRTSEEQATVGTPVASLADAQPGDLLFFAGSDGTAQSPGHVGIYVGNGQMIDAPYTGTTVQQQAVSSAGPVVAIRRIDAPATATSFGSVDVPSQYAATITSAAAANHIPASLLASLLSHESGFNPTAVSGAGAEGIAQFMPSTAAGLGIDPYDPTQAIAGAAHLLGAYTQRFGSYGLALAAYNAGPNAVVEYGGVPPYTETQTYVSEVLASAGLSSTGGVA